MILKNSWMNKVILFVFSFLFFTILNIAYASPVAVITGPELVLAGDTVNLSAQSSIGNQLKYRWKIVYSPEGSGAQLNNGTQSETSFVVDREGVYIVELRALEGATWSVPKYLTVSSAISVGEIILNPETFEASFLCKVTFGLYDCDEVVRDFAVNNPSGNYSLVIQNEGVKKAFLNLNGSDLTDYYQLNGSEETVVKTTELLAQNQLKIRFGRPGSFGELTSKMTIKIVKNQLPGGSNAAPVLSANPIQYFGSIGGRTQLTIADPDQTVGHVISVLVPPSNGEVTLSPNGQVTYEPDSFFLGDDEVVLLVRDSGTPKKATAIVIPIHYENGNEPPLLSSTFAGISNGETVSGKIVVKDTVGQTHTFVIVDNPSNGTATVDSAGNVIYTPGNNFVGLDTFKIRVTDSGSPGAYSDIIIPIDVYENHAPTISNVPTLEVEQGMPGVTTFAFGDIDQGQTVIFGLKTMPLHGLASIQGNGRVVYMPDSLFYGQDLLEVVVRDNGHPNQETVMSLVIEVAENRPPVITFSSSLVRGSPGVTITAPFFVSDVNNGQNLSNEIVKQPEHGVATLIGKSVAYTAEAGYFGQDEVTVAVIDNGSPSKKGFATLSILVEENHPPAPSLSGSTITAGKERFLFFYANDPDPGQTHTYSISSFPANGVLTFSPSWNNALYYKPNPGFIGNDTFKVVVTDNGMPIMATELTVVMSVRANSAPTFLSLPVLKLAQGSAGNQNIPYTDIDGDKVTLSVIGTPNLVTASFNGDTLIYKADKGLSGIEAITVQAKDDGNPSLTTTTQVNIEVDANHAPLPDNQDLIVGKDQSLSIFIRANDPDPAQGAIFTLASNPANGVVTQLEGGTFSYKPNAGFTGNDEFNVTVTDTGTPPLSANAKVTLHVVQNFPPSPIANDIKVLENSPGSTGIIPRDPNPGQTHRYAVVVEPTNGTVVTYSNGFVSYVPRPGFIGQDQFVVSVTDSGVPALSTNIVIAVEVEKNFPPNPIANNVNIIQGEQAQIDISPNDPNTVEQSFTYEIVKAPINGYLGGSYTRWYYTPAYEFFGTDSFVVKVTDSGNPRLSALKTVSINVVKNIAPTVMANNISTFQGTAGTSQISFTDVEPNQTHRYEIPVPPSHGTASIQANGLLTYMPALGYSGADTLTVAVRDSAYPSGVGTKQIQITVQANSIPVVVAANSLTTFQSTAVSTQVNFTDADAGQNHTYSVQTSPQHGTASFNAQGLLTYTPTTGYSGSDSVTVAVSDDANPRGVGTKEIQLTIVKNVNPTVIANDISTFQSTTATTQVTYTDVEPDQQHTYVVITAPQHGTAAINAAGLLTYTPHSGYSGSDVVTVGVRDSAIPAGEGTKIINISIMANAVPVVMANNIFIFQGQQGTTQASYTDPDVGQGHSYFISQYALYGSVNVSAEGVVSYNPYNVCVSSNDTFKVAVADDANPPAYGEKEIQVLVTPNTQPVVAIEDIVVSQGGIATKSITITDPDAGQNLSFYVDTYPQSGNLTLDPMAKTLTYANNGTNVTEDSFVMAVKDDFGQCPGQVVKKTVLVHIGSNHAPVLAVNDLVVEENSFANVTVTATDEDSSQILSYAISVQPAHGNATLYPGTGQFTYNPLPNYRGADQLKVRVTDNGTPQLSDEKTINITVVPMNYPPVPTANSMALLSGKTATTQILANDSDVSQIHTYEILAPLQFGWASVSTMGLVTYHAFEGASGSEQIQVKVTDNGTFPRYAIINIPVEVVGNQAPNPAGKIIADAVSGMTETFTILPNDPNHARFPQIYTFSISNQPSAGTVSVNQDGLVIYTSPVGFTGNIEFDVAVSDQGTPVLTGEAHVAINVVANSAPVVAAQTLSTLKNVSVQQQIAFTDANSAKQTFAYAISQQPGHGSVTVNTQGLLTYTPSANYFGADEFIVRVSDNGNPSMSGVAIYSINISDSTNTPPTIDGIEFFTADITLPKTYEFHLNDLHDDTGVKEVRVNFGDGTETLVLNVNSPIVKNGEFSLDNFKHIYRQNGTYSVSVVALDTQNAQAQFQTTVQIGNNAAPVARVNFSPLQGAVPLNLTADGSASTDSDGSIIQYCLDIDKDGEEVSSNCSDSSLTLSYQLTEEGIYHAKACVLDNQNTYSCREQTVYAGVAVPGMGAYKAFAAIDASQRVGSAPLNNVTLSGSRSVGFNNASIVEYQWVIRGQVANKFGKKYEKFLSGVNQTVSFPYSGVYDVSLLVIDQNGNEAEAATQIFVEENITDALSIYAVYQGDNNFQFKINTVGLLLASDRVSWDLGNGEFKKGFEANATLSSGSIYQVKVEAYDHNGKKYTAVKSIDLTQALTAPNIVLQSIPETVQLNQSFSINAGSTTDSSGGILQYRWWMGDGTSSIVGNGSNFSQIVHTYTTLGMKTLRLIVSNSKGISSEVELKINVVSGQPATLATMLNPSSGASPLFVSGSAQANSGVILSYTWNYDRFGKGRIKTGQYTTNTYYQAGEYSVWVDAIDSNGNQISQFVDTARAFGANHVPVVAAATITTPQNKKVTYDVEYTDDDEETQLHTFSISNAPANGTATISDKGRLVYIPNANYTGVDSLKVRVTDSAVVPAYGEAVISIQVTGNTNQNPVIGEINYIYETASFPRETYIFADGISDSDGQVVKVTWDFGDGSAPLVLESNQVDGYDEILHQYRVAGNYTVTITAEDNQGGITTETTVVSLAANQLPRPGVTVSKTGTGPYQVTVNASGSTDADGTISLYCFTIGSVEGEIYNDCSSSPTVTVTTNNTGAFVGLELIDNNRGASYYESSFVIGSPATLTPFASFESSVARMAASSPLTVPWTSSASRAMGGNSISRKFWELSDWQLNGGIVAEGETASNDYLYPGTHFAKLTVFDSSNRRSSAERLVYIGQNLPVVADFTAKAENNDTIEFNAADWSHGHLANFFLWDFGDGSSGFERFSSHTYNRSGKYEVKLSVMDIYGNIDISEQVIVVGGDTPSATQNGGSRQVTNINAPTTLSVSGNPDDIVRWNFGDGTFDSGPISDKGSVSHVFTQRGVHRIRANVTSEDSGLSRDFYKVMTVLNGIADPQLQIVPSVSSGTSPLTVNFAVTAAPTFVMSNYRWVLKDQYGVIHMSSASNTSWTMYQPGNYTMEVYVRDAAGNRDYASYGIAVSGNSFRKKAFEPKINIGKLSKREEHRLKLLNKIMNARK